MKVVSPLRTRGGVNCQEGDKDRTAETDASLTSLEGVDAVFVLAGQNHHRPPPSAARHLLCQTLSYRTGSVLRRPSRTCSPVLSSWVGGKRSGEKPCSPQQRRFPPLTEWRSFCGKLIGYTTESEGRG